MNLQEIKKTIEESSYWDRRIIELNCKYFADEIEFVYVDNSNHRIKYIFTGCYYSEFNHQITYDKLQPAKNMSIAQIPYFLQDITVDGITKNDREFISCKISSFPLDINIICENITITTEVSL